MSKIPKEIATSILNPDADRDARNKAERKANIQNTYRQAAWVIENGYTSRQNVNGEPLIVSDAGYKVVVDDVESTFRIYKTIPDRKSEEPVVGILNDVDPGVGVVTTNQTGITFDATGNIVVGANLPSDINVNPSDETCNYVIEIVNTITKAAEREWYVQRMHKAEIRQNRLDTAKWLAKGVGAVGLAGVLVIGGYKGFNAVRDAVNYDGPPILDPPTVLQIGDSGHPAFSPQSVTQGQDYDDLAGSWNDADAMGLNGTYEMWIRSSEDGKNCKERRLSDADKKKLGVAQLNTWTDAMNPDGTPRNKEITVTYTYDEIKACWDGGVERDKSDDLRVIFQLTNGAEVEKPAQ